MKRLATIALKFVALGIPMVIAACYGVSARFSRSGKVLDGESHDPLQDIKISCVDTAGTASDYTNSGTDGSWYLYYDVACDHLDAEDTMSPPRYVKTTVPFPSGDGSIINMTKVK